MTVPPSLTEGQVQAIDTWIQAFGDQFFGFHKARRADAIIKLGLLAGLRVGEISNLKWSDVTVNEQDGGQIYVRKSNAKGKKARTIPLSVDLQIALLSWSNCHPEPGIRQTQTHVIWNVCTYDKLTVRQIRRIFQKVGEVAILRPTHPHLYRHTFANRLIRSGTDIRTIQQLMGHSSIASTEKYLHPDEITRRRAIMNMPKLGSNGQ